jgi:2-polyprenyl-3-methyl-5-hydroxy-6-metoxy-1,4-benzoquinol methylase
MEREQIESESKLIAEYFKKHWPLYVDVNFDRTFSLRNWTTTMATIALKYNKSKFNKKSNNYQNKLKTIFKNKKFLHIGCGYGYFLEVVESLGGTPFGIEPYCSFPEGLKIVKAKIEDLQEGNSSLTRELKGEKFDIIVAHDLFLFSILIDKENAHRIVKSLKNYLNKNGIMAFENLNEELLLEKDEIEKFGFKAERMKNIMNPYGNYCEQIIIRNKFK